MWLQRERVDRVATLKKRVTGRDWINEPHGKHDVQSGATSKAGKVGKARHFRHARQVRQAKQARPSMAGLVGADGGKRQT